MVFAETIRAVLDLMLAPIIAVVGDIYKDVERDSHILSCQRLYQTIVFAIKQGG